MAATLGIAEWSRGSDGITPAPSRSGIARSTRRVQARVMLFGDLAALTVAVAAVGALRFHRWASGDVVDLLVALLPLYAAVAFNGGSFARDALKRWQTGVRRALTSLGLTAMMLLGIGFALKVSADFSRLVIAGGLATAGVTIAGTRFVNRFLIDSLLPDGVIDVALLVDGVRLPFAGVARVVDAAHHGLAPSLDSPHMLDRIGKALDGCDRVIVSCPPDRRQPWAAALKGLGSEVQMLVPELDTLGMLGIARFDDQLAAVVARGPLRMADMIAKRAFDLGCVLFCLPLLGLATAVVALLIKLDDGGPVFFRQPRIGRGNRIFAVVKFRSMRCDAADGEGLVSTIRGDERLTRVGQWLRRTSLDELPQLANVLCGDMSIVGPRPHALGSTAEAALFWDVDRRYWLRHAVKPGLTGLAQVRGFRGATAKTADVTNRIQSDLDYMVGWTIWRDLRIVASPARVLFHANAFRRVSMMVRGAMLIGAVALLAMAFPASAKAVAQESTAERPAKARGRPPSVRPRWHERFPLPRRTSVVPDGSTPER